MERKLESDERVIHRIEAFADIVIGFSLAQLGVNLVVPAHAIQLYTHPVGLFAFAMTFLIVCRMWWSHHRLFTHFFVPQPVPIALCFVTLGVLVFAVYALQLFLHFGAGDPVALMTYLCAYGVLFILLGAQYLIGWFLRRRTLDATIAEQGHRQGLSQLLIGAAFLVSGGMIYFVGTTSRAFATYLVALMLVIAAIRMSLRRRSKQSAAQVG